MNCIMKLKNEDNTILSDQVNKQILKLRQKQLELNDSPRTLLGRQLLTASRSTQIIIIF